MYPFGSGTIGYSGCVGTVGHVPESVGHPLQTSRTPLTFVGQLVYVSLREDTGTTATP